MLASIRLLLRVLRLLLVLALALIILALLLAVVVIAAALRGASVVSGHVYVVISQGQGIISVLGSRIGISTAFRKDTQHRERLVNTKDCSRVVEVAR